MENESSFITKLKIAKEVLKQIISKDKYDSAALVRNGELLDITLAGETSINLHELTRKVEGLMSRRQNSGPISEEITVHYPQKKILFARLDVDGVDDPFWLLVCMESNVLYFRRFFKEIFNQLKILFS